MTVTRYNKGEFAYEYLHPGGRGERVDVALVPPSRRAPPCGDPCRVTSERSRKLTRYAGASPQAVLYTVSAGPCRLGGGYARVAYNTVPPTTSSRVMLLLCSSFVAKCIVTQVSCGRSLVLWVEGTASFIVFFVLYMLVQG
jgi:hypothetical protein